METKYYVVYFDLYGYQKVTCFENEETQALHFANMVHGDVIKEVNGRKIVAP